MPEAPLDQGSSVGDGEIYREATSSVPSHSSVSPADLKIYNTTTRSNIPIMVTGQDLEYGALYDKTSHTWSRWHRIVPSPGQTPYVIRSIGLQSDLDRLANPDIYIEVSHGYC